MDRVAIGMDIGGTGTKAGLVDRGGRVLAKVERPTDRSAGTKGIIELAEELLGRAPDIDIEVACIGIGAAGFVDAAGRSITFSPNLTYDDPHIADAVEARLGLPALLDNDANMSAWGERAFGSAKGLDHLAVIMVGTGIGSGFVVAGELLRGSSGAGAEFGHTIVELEGPLCNCGLRGCLEQFASGTGIARMAMEAVAEDPDSSILQFSGSAAEVTAEHVTKAAREYDETARKVLATAGGALGVGLSNVVNVFDPEAIVVGGGVVKAGEPYLGPARDQLFEMTTAQRRRPVRLDISILGGQAGIVGAAALALDELDRAGAE